MKFNIGCGWRDFGKGWINIDGGDYEHLDSDDIFIKDYENNSADLIYSSHFIEYLDRDEVIPLLERWKEVLKPNGVMRLAVPNFDAVVQYYIEKDDNMELLLGQLVGGQKTGEYDYHKMVFSKKSLTKALLDTDFSEVMGYDWRKTEHADLDDFSQSYLPHMDKDNGFLLSLNLEAVK